MATCFMNRETVAAENFEPEQFFLKTCYIPVSNLALWVRQLTGDQWTLLGNRDVPQ